MTQGTVSREGLYVYGTCSVCGSSEVLVYETDAETGLVCASDYRIWSKRHPVVQACDDCGATGNVWRDPVSRKNEYYCATCHGNRGKVFTNRWSTYAREGYTLGIHDKAQCEAAGYGTECWGEVKWRGSDNRLLCNKHAGKQSAGPDWHQKRQ